MCGTHTKEAADHALRSPLDPEDLLRLFTMTVKGKWTDVLARPHFLIITFLERVYIYPHLWYDNARNLGFREVTSCPNTSLQSTSLLCRTPSNSKAAVNVRLPASPLAKQAAPLAT